MRSFPLEKITLDNIKPIIEEQVDPDTHFITDEAKIYHKIGPMFAKHSKVKHQDGEYARREENFTVTTNTVESFFALLKRSNYGIHHHMSRKYLASYCAERDFVYKARRISDDKRTDKALKGASGRRLMLKKPKGS